MSEPLNRRRFTHQVAAGLAALGGAASASGAEKPALPGPPAAPGAGAPGPRVPEGTREPVRGTVDAAGSVFREAARDVPLVETTDVLVCGAGPAGVAAAIAAARSGARVRLLEVHGCLGGVWTAGALSWILDSANKPGLMAEIIRRLHARGAEQTTRTGVAYDVELMKLVLEQMCLEAGVRMQYHTRVVAATRGADNRLAVVITESKSGRQAWAARTFIDTTGDGDVAALAGCGFDLGRPGTGETQPMSLMALLTGISPAEMAPFTRELAEAGGWAAPKDRLRAEFEKGGASPSYAKPTMFHLREDLFALMANHEYRVSALDAGQMTEATLRARAELHQLVDALRSQGGIWAGVKIVATGAQIGVREGRRIHGLYTVTQDDLAVGARHDDAVCRVTFPIDVHSTNPDKSKAIEAKPVTSRPYDIPLRALIARDVDGLMLAGRPISGDFIAHSSYRVTGNAVAMGQAAGVTSALAVAAGGVPREVPWSDVAAALARLDFLRPPGAG